MNGATLIVYKKKSSSRSSLSLICPPHSPHISAFILSLPVPSVFLSFSSLLLTFISPSSAPHKIATTTPGYFRCPQLIEFLALRTNVESRRRKGPKKTRKLYFELLAAQQHGQVIPFDGFFYSETNSKSNLY